MSISQWFSSLFSRVVPATFPKLEMRRIVDNAGARDWKTSSITIAKCGLLVATYHNITREDSAIDLVDPKTGKSRNILRNDNETLGKPVLSGGWWYFPAENRVGKIYRVRDADGRVETTSRTQPEDYSCVGLDKWFPISLSGRKGGSKPRLWNFITGEHGYRYKKVHGIASGFCAWAGQRVISVSDGSESGVETDAGHAITDDLVQPRANWATPTINTVAGKLIAMLKDGRVIHIESFKPIKTKVIGNLGIKAVRSVSTGALIFWTTSRPDAVCATNGVECKRLWDIPGPDTKDGTSRGELFDTDLDIRGNQIAVARSQDKAGFEVWIGNIK
jgi:hypothetical protein